MFFQFCGTGTNFISDQRILDEKCHPITITGSRCGPFEPALKLLKEEKVKLPAIELYDLSDFESAFSSKAFKAGFRL